MIRGQVIQLRPSAEQSVIFARASGIARFTYNWALEQWKRQAQAWWEAGKTGPYPTPFALMKQFNAIRSTEYPWTKEVTYYASQRAIAAVGHAFDLYHAGLARYPRFKSKLTAKRGFCACFRSSQISCKGKSIELPRVGAVRTNCHLRWENASIRRVDISYRAGRWYASVLCEIPDADNGVRVQATAGVDLGIKSPITLTVDRQPIAVDDNNLLERLNVERRKLRGANKALHRRVKGSGRRRRAQVRVGRIQMRMARVRADFQHKATRLVVQSATHVGVETLGVRGMLANGHLARRIADVGFYEIKRQLRYKLEETGGTLVEAGKWFPSSKTCSCCGSVKSELKLSERTFNCDDCGFTADRDVNAALNLEKLAADHVVSARGDGSSAKPRKRLKHSLSAKRENSAARKSGMKSESSVQIGCAPELALAIPSEDKP